MQNSQKLQLLQNKIKEHIACSNIGAEQAFEFAKKLAKEMQIEISKGELKIIVNNIFLLNKHSQNSYTDEYDENPLKDLMYNSDYIII